MEHSEVGTSELSLANTSSCNLDELLLRCYKLEKVTSMGLREENGEKEPT